jgi:cell wall-associated NlpC family hydrolase
MASTLTLLLVFLAACGSQRPAVVTVKQRAAVSEAKAPDLVAVKAKPEPRKSAKPTNQETAVTRDDAAVELVAKTAVTTASATALTIEERAIEAAETYLGVRYRYAGTSHSGIDCSGLMNQVYEELGVSIPRTSGGIMNITAPVLLNHAQPGDFVFFATGRSRARVSHVGMVTRVVNGDVEFIHASTSQGVIKSMLSERYWNNAFLRAGRIE